MISQTPIEEDKDVGASGSVDTESGSSCAVLDDAEIPYNWTKGRSMDPALVLFSTLRLTCANRMADHRRILLKQLCRLCRGIDIHTGDRTDCPFLQRLYRGRNSGIELVSIPTYLSKRSLTSSPSYVFGYCTGPLVFAPMSEVPLPPLHSPPSNPPGLRPPHRPHPNMGALRPLPDRLRPRKEHRNSSNLPTPRRHLRLTSTHRRSRLHVRHLAAYVPSPYLTPTNLSLPANELGPPLGLFTMAAFLGPVAGTPPPPLPPQS